MPKQHVLYIICILNERNRARRFRSSTADDKSRQDRDDVGAARQPFKERRIGCKNDFLSETQLRSDKRV